MNDFWSRIAVNLTDRVHGPLSLRLILQPVVASIFGILSGLRDARAHRPPYLWTLLVNSSDRGKMIKDGWKSVGKVFIVALVLDVIYQVIVPGFVYSGETLIVGFILTIVPYLLLRELINAIFSKRRTSDRPTGHSQ
jgi:hypothetical protein